MRIFFLAIFCICCVFQQTGHSAELVSLKSQVRELTQIVKGLELTVETQQREIASLKAAQGASSVLNTVPPAPSYGGQSTQASRPGWKIIPEIGAVADMALRLDSPKSDGDGADRVSVREIELVLGGNVDPYSRFDSTVAFIEKETVELEEAYLTRFQLPLETTARIGRFKPRIGKDLAVHRDSLDTVDEPLVIQRYFGEEGMSKSGVDVTKLLDIPSPIVHQLTLGILEGGNGEGGTVFGNTKRRPTVYGRLKNYLDISDTANLEVGLSDAAGSRDPDSSFEVNVLGVDGTFIYHLNPNQNIKLQGEVFNVNREESQTETVDDATSVVSLNNLDGNIWGGYGLIDFRINPQWGAGFRYDQVQIVNRPVNSPGHYDYGYSGYLTFYQSEFVRWRTQFTHLDLTDGSEDNQVLVQGTFAMGDHKHKLQ